VITARHRDGDIARPSAAARTVSARAMSAARLEGPDAAAG
jgi:hypothetical protein